MLARYIHFCSNTYLTILFILEIQVVKYFREQTCRSVMEADIGVFIKGIDKNYIKFEDFVPYI